MKKIILILLLIISACGLKAQESPQSSSTPSDPFPGVVAIQNYWNTGGYTASFTTGSELGTKNAYPLYLITKDTTRMTIDTIGNITDNKHLPGIISATEVDRQGDVDLGEMNTKLLEKIEELALYIIDLQKQIDELKNGKE